MALTTSTLGNIFVVICISLFIPSNGEIKKCASGLDTEGCKFIIITLFITLHRVVYIN